MKTVTLTIENQIAQVFLNRPEQSNSLVLDTFKELVRVCEQIQRERGVRAVVLSGKGKHFCAGLDRTLFPQKPGNVAWFNASANTALDTQGANLFQRCVSVWKEVPVPVIAAVNGAALGGGCQLALGADIRLGDASTRLALIETRWGLIPDMAMTQSLPPLCKQDVAAELILSARTIDANEAKDAGLITRITEDCQAAALELAETIARKSPEAIRAAKTLYQSAWQTDPSLLKLEAQLQGQLIGSPNQIEAVHANLNAREPKFH